LGSRTEIKSLAARILSGSSELSFEVVYDLTASADTWRKFEGYADCTAFQCFDWLHAWQLHVGRRNGTAPAVVFGYAGDELFLIFPLGVQRVGAVRELRFLGRGICDYNAPLLHPHFNMVTDREFQSLWDHICTSLRQQDLTGYDVIVLEKMPQRLGNQANPFIRLGVRPHPAGAYQTTLVDNWDSFYASRRSADTRRRDRTKLRQMSKLGSVEFKTAASRDEIQNLLDTLFVQKRRALAKMGAPDIFAQPGHIQFFADIASRPCGSPAVHVSGLRVGDTCAAVNLGLEFRNCYYHVLASYDDGPAARFGPGAAHLRDLIAYAIARGCFCFDFTIGDEPYKLDWSDQKLDLYDHVHAVSLRGTVGGFRHEAQRRVKRALKQSRYWPTLARIRSRLAGG
jgi:CelD/BcsL family acetyltransferase involved in cellulose biosynthesis